MSQKTLFLIGPGFIGGSLLVRLKEARPDLKLTALTRRDEQAKELSSLGIEPIKGGLDDFDVIKKHASQADIIIHTATADHEKSAFAVVDGIKSRSDKSSRKVVYIHTSGNDELVNSAKGMSDASVEEKTLSDIQGDEILDKRIQSDAPHRHTDGPLRKMIANEEQEKEHNVSMAIMMPPLIYGTSSKPWERLSIQTPMLANFMMEKGIVALPKDHPNVWNSVWVHDLVEAYIILLADLEKHTPGSPQPAHIVFPTETKPFLWRDLFDTIASELKKAGHPSAKSEPKILDKQSFYEFVGGKGNPYGSIFQSIVFDQENSFTRAE